MDDEQRRWNVKVTYGAFILASLLFIETSGSHTKPCPSGWITYQRDTPYTCVSVSVGSTSTVEEAQKECIKMDSNLMKIETNSKASFFKDTIKKNLNTNTKVWIGLTYNSGTLYWISKGGNIPVKKTPGFLDSAKYRFQNYYEARAYGVYYYGESFSSANRRYLNSRYFCEKKAECEKGWFGLGCNKECHCYGQECEPLAADVTCSFGCQVGWMGQDCSKRKQNADVKYYCVNSKEQGKYAHVRIYTKGVSYENIYVMDEHRTRMPWCNGTIVDESNSQEVFIIKIPINDNGNESIEAGECAGNMVENGTYEWRLKIQEFDGLNSRNDQEVLLKCDFSDADNLHVSETTHLKTKIKPMKLVEKTEELVKLKVVDSATKQPVDGIVLGTPVALKITYGLNNDSMVKGVHPFNCEASTVDDSTKELFLNAAGCPVANSPVSQFHTNGSRELITDPFPLFGLDGQKAVKFHCSYILCFGDSPCPVGCQHGEDYSRHVLRHRRSIRSIVAVLRAD